MTNPEQQKNEDFAKRLQTLQPASRKDRASEMIWAAGYATACQERTSKAGNALGLLAAAALLVVGLSCVSYQMGVRKAGTFVAERQAASDVTEDVDPLRKTVTESETQMAMERSSSEAADREKPLFTQQLSELRARTAGLDWEAFVFASVNDSSAENYGASTTAPITPRSYLSFDSASLISNDRSL